MDWQCYEARLQYLLTRFCRFLRKAPKQTQKLWTLLICQLFRKASTCSMNKLFFERKSLKVLYFKWFKVIGCCLKKIGISNIMCIDNYKWKRDILDNTDISKTKLWTKVVVLHGSSQLLFFYYSNKGYF